MKQLYYRYFVEIMANSAFPVYRYMETNISYYLCKNDYNMNK